jgi:hypothetical protein
VNAALHRSFAAAEAVLLASLREVTLARLSAEFRKRYARCSRMRGAA